MPMPLAYRQATQEFERFLDELLAISSLSTRNQCYTMTRSVFIVFRSHMAPQQAMDFAQSLPAVLRAIFVEDWDLAASIRPFGDRTELIREVKSVREEHNFSTDNAIAEVALALRRVMTPGSFDFMLSRLPDEARNYWRTS